MRSNSSPNSHNDTYPYRYTHPPPAKRPCNMSGGGGGDHGSTNFLNLQGLGDSPKPGRNIPSGDDHDPREMKQVGSSSGGGKSDIDKTGSGLRNFSMFLKPELLVKGCGGASYETARSTSVGPSSLRLEEPRPSNVESRSRNQQQQQSPAESSLVVSSRRPNYNRSPGEVLKYNKDKRVDTPLTEPPPVDEESKAVVNRNFGNGSGNKCGGQVEGLRPSNTPYRTEKLPMGTHQLGWTSSTCSRGASNDVGDSLRHRHEENDAIASPSESSEEEEPASLARLGARRKRKAQGHNASEKKRRGKINKRLKELQHLLPNSNKVDKASMLDDAIAYIKTLQLQLHQMMSMGQGLYNYMPQMMLQNGSMRHIHAPQLAPFHPLMGLAFGSNLPPGSAAGCNSAPLPTIPAMLGLQRQLVAPLPTTLPCAPSSVPFVGGQLPVPVPPHVSSMDQLVSTPLFIGSNDQSHQNLHPRIS